MEVNTTIIKEGNETEDLGSIVTNHMNWAENGKTRSGKALKAL